MAVGFSHVTVTRGYVTVTKKGHLKGFLPQSSNSKIADFTITQDLHNECYLHTKYIDL